MTVLTGREQELVPGTRGGVLTKLGTLNSHKSFPSGMLSPFPLEGAFLPPRDGPALPHLSNQGWLLRGSAGPQGFSAQPTLFTSRPVTRLTSQQAPEGRHRTREDACYMPEERPELPDLCRQKPREHGVR